jgi:hypothetical protein
MNLLLVLFVKGEKMRYIERPSLARRVNTTPYGRLPLFFHAFFYSVWHSTTNTQRLLRKESRNQTTRLFPRWGYLQQFRLLLARLSGREFL